MKCYCAHIILIVSFLCITTLTSKAQDNQLVATFVKSTCSQSCDSLYFNVLKIENISSKTLIVEPKITIPNEFNLMSRIPRVIKLYPGKTKHIPFRISILKTANSGKKYKIAAQILNEDGQIISTSLSLVSIREKRDWHFELDDSELIFSGEKNTETALAFRISNRGNIKEKIFVNIQIPAGFKAANENRKKTFIIHLNPGKDSTFHYKIIQKHQNQELNFSDKVKVQVYNDYSNYSRQIKISSYSNFFDYSPIKEKTNSYIEYSRRSMDGLKEIKDELRAKGIVPLKNDNRLLFSFNNYDLSNTEEFWERSNYQLIFEGKKFSGGIGQHYTNLLVDSYNPHAAFAKWKLPYSKRNEIELYASQGLDYNITSVAAGNQLVIDKILIKTSAGYNQDERRKQNSKSAILSASVPISRNHRMTLNAKGIEREYYKDSTYTQNGIQANWSYFGRFTPRMYMSLKNRFQTRGFYSGNQSDNQLLVNLNYRVSQKSRLLLEYAYNSRAGGSSDYKIKSHTLKPVLAFRTRANQNIKTGLWLEEYENINSETTNLSRSCNVWLETSSRQGSFNYSFSAVTGLRFQDTKSIENGEIYQYQSVTPKFLVEARANIAPFAIRCSYINGSQKGTSLSQRANYNELRLSPSIRQSILHDKILLELQADYQLDWVYNRKSINIRPRFSWALKNNWTLLADAYISAYGDRGVTLDGNDLNTNIRFSIRKDFNIGKRRKKEKYHQMDMVFYRDDNKNGRKDKDEKGIENSLISAEKQRLNKEEKYVQLSKLVSQKNGKITYANLPEGSYKLDINQMTNTDGYFNFEGNKMNVTLDKDTTLFIPYIKAYKIQGKLELKKSRISSNKVGQISNIKITATDSHGKTFSCLTSSSGYYQLPVAGKDTYTVSIHNPYGRRIKVNNNNSKVDFSTSETEEVNFQFVEKRRKVNMRKASTSRSKSHLQKRNTESKKNIAARKPAQKPVANNKNIHKIKPIERRSIPNEKVVTTANSKSGEVLQWTYIIYVSEANVYEHYTVVGAYHFKSNAIKVQQSNKEKNIKSFIKYNPDKQLYYVCIKKIVVRPD